MRKKVKIIFILLLLLSITIINDTGYCRGEGRGHLFNHFAGISNPPPKPIPNKSDVHSESKPSEDYSGVFAVSIADVTPVTADRLMRLAIKKNKIAVVRMYLSLREFKDLDRQEEEHIASLPEQSGEEAILHDLDQELEVTDPVLKRIYGRKQEIVEEFRRIDSKEKKEFMEVPDVIIAHNRPFIPLEELLLKTGESYSLLGPSFEPPFFAPDMLKTHPALMIASGVLHGPKNPDFIHEKLGAYLNTGGTVIVFSQSNGSDYGVLPVPQEPDRTFRRVSGYGYKEDQSFFTDATCIDKWHQVLAGQSRNTQTLHINGYFTNFPSTATVLLRKKANSHPVMIIYPYGQGFVVVTSLYSEFTDGSKQPSPEEVALICDLISWAKKPAKLVVMKPGEKVSLSISVSNRTTHVAVSIKLLVYNPGRSTLVSQQDAKKSISPGSSTQTSMEYSAPLTAPLGIYHVDYQLYNGKGIMIQPAAETDSGRFAVRKAETMIRNMK